MKLKRIIVMVLLALSLATTVHATLPPIETGQGPYACYKVIAGYWWIFVGFYWEDHTAEGWLESVYCYYRY